jgi:hypothetical protein
MYALAMANQAHPDERVSAALIRAAKFLRENYMGPGARPGQRIVWSQPLVQPSNAQSSNPRERYAELGGTGLSLVALAAARHVDPQSVSLEELQAMGRFAIFLQRDDGSFVHKYREQGGPDQKWKSLYYPGEAALGFVALYEADHSPEWLAAAGKALSYLAKTRAGLSIVPPDHWALIATAKLLPYCEDRGCGLPRAELIRHAGQLCESILRDQFKSSVAMGLDGAFDSAGRTAPAASRLEGLLAAVQFLPQGDLHDKVNSAIPRGISFLVRAQVVSGSEAGAMPGGILTREYDSSEVRIDFVQHSLCAWLRYENRLRIIIDGSLREQNMLLPYAFEFLRTRYRFENDGTGTEEIEARIRVQTQSAAEQFPEFTFQYRPSKQRLKVLSVHVLRHDGKVVNVESAPPPNPHRVFREGGTSGFDFYERTLPLPAISPGDALEYDVETVSYAAETPGNFSEAYSFSREGVLNERLEIDVPIGRELKLKTNPRLKSSLKSEKGRRIYSWAKMPEASDFEIGQSITNSPTNEVPDVQISSFRDWEEVGRWYAEVERSGRVPSPEVRAKADELINGLKSDLKKVQALYEFVAQKINYLSLVSVGIAGYEPRTAADVLRLGYGDCKDKDTLLATLLEAEGMHASSVLVNPIRELDPEMPSPWSFTHVITLMTLGKDEIWMDSSSNLPFGKLPSALNHKNGLVIPPQGTPHFEEVIIPNQLDTGSKTQPSN